MKKSHPDRDGRVRDMRRIFDEYGFGDVGLLDDWDGVSVEYLAEILSEEEFELLLDRLTDDDRWS